MIPLVDDYIQSMIRNKLQILKENSKLLEYVFRTNNSKTIQRLKEFITTRKIQVIIGYPREQTSLPAYVITLAPEQEQSSGLGDNIDTYSPDYGEDDNYETTASLYVDDYITSSYINGTYRIECWSDNGDLTAYMYCILKWCLLASRKEMLQFGWLNITISGTDLEPVPDYFPIFVYRRAAQLSLTYDNQYYEDLDQMLVYLDILVNPQNYYKDEDGNIRKLDGTLVVSSKHSFIFKTHMFTVGQPEVLDVKSSNSAEGSAIIPSLVPIISQEELPKIGDMNTMYICRSKEGYKTYIWNPTLYRYETGFLNEVNYDNLVIFDKKS